MKIIKGYKFVPLVIEGYKIPSYSDTTNFKLIVKQLVVVYVLNNL